MLQGIVGSVAYGLATPESDVDRLGGFFAPTEEFLGLGTPTQTYVTHEPDQTLHELGKLCALLLKANPTVTELLWLDSYEIATGPGLELVRMRDKFLSATPVRNAYFGYATQQFRKLCERDGTFSSDTIHRTAKHGRHLLRLLDQGLTLYQTGHLSVLLADPERYMDFGRAVAKDPTVGATAIAEYEAKFNSLTSPLPDRPAHELVNDWLVETRKRMMPDA